MSDEPHNADALELKDRVMNRWLEENFAKGKAKGKAETLLKFLALRLDAIPPAMEQRIREADCTTLDGWIDRIAEGARPRDVIRH